MPGIEKADFKDGAYILKIVALESSSRVRLTVLLAVCLELRGESFNLGL